MFSAFFGVVVLLQHVGQTWALPPPDAVYSQSLNWFYTYARSYSGMSSEDYQNQRFLQLQNTFADMPPPAYSGFILCNACRDGGISLGPHTLHPIPDSLRLLDSANEAVAYRCASPQGMAVRSEDMQACLGSASVLRQRGAALGAYHFEYYVSTAAHESDQTYANTFLVATASMEVNIGAAPASGPVSVVGPNAITLQACDTCYSAITDITSVHYNLGDKIHLDSADSTPILSMTVGFASNGPLFLFAHGGSWSTSVDTPSGGWRSGSCSAGGGSITMYNSASPNMWRSPVKTVYLDGIAPLYVYAACLHELDVLADPGASVLSVNTTGSITIDITTAGNGRNYFTSSVIQLQVARDGNTDAANTIMPQPPTLQINNDISVNDCEALTLASVFRVESIATGPAYLTHMAVTLTASDADVTLALQVLPAARMWGGRTPTIYDVDYSYMHDVNFYTANASRFSGKYFFRDGETGSSGWPEMFPWNGLGGSRQAHALAITAACGRAPTSGLSTCTMEFTAYSVIPQAGDLQTALRLVGLYIAAPCKEESYALQAEMTVQSGPRWENNAHEVSSVVQLALLCSPPACPSATPQPSVSSQPTTSTLPQTSISNQLAVNALASAAVTSSWLSLAALCAIGIVALTLLN